MRLQWGAYLRLARFDKPIGTILLGWPALWGLWLASDGDLPAQQSMVFLVGVILMRAAGCVVNDYFDRDFDQAVWRTQQRPLARRDMEPTQALLFLLVLLVAAASLLFFLNNLTRVLAVCALLLALIYPLMKRITYWPQLILGLAFSMPIPMAYAAVLGTVPSWSWWLYAATVCWVVAYDTQYALADRDDDVRIGVKSTAVLFAHRSHRAVAVMQTMSISLFLMLGWVLALPAPYFIACGAGAVLFLFQHHWMQTHQPKDYLLTFKSNAWFGVLLTLGLVFAR